MSLASLYSTDFVALEDSDSVGTATQAMRRHGATDLPVVDAGGRLVGVFRLDRVLASLLPKAALIGFGMADLRFVNNSLDDLRAHMQAIEHEPIAGFVIPFAHFVTPATSPMELVLLLYRGAHSVPVVDADHRLLGMVSARELLAALHQQT